MKTAMSANETRSGMRRTLPRTVKATRCRPRSRTATAISGHRTSGSQWFVRKFR
jgi:hypothetical protein